MCGAANQEDARQSSAASSPCSIKGSLSFILDDAPGVKRTANSAELDESTASKSLRPSVSTISINNLLAPVVDENDVRNATRATTPLGRKSSKYCIVEGCISRAKHARRCWKHGGSIECKVVGCRNRAKTKGVCWSHGGGTICSADQCTTVSVSNGVCWAHGGGKRCVTPGCARPAYQRTRNMCSMHFNARLSSNVSAS
ncbi:hypothetical protein GN958_ATG16275 [Phytophthora infestans]|uniref:WRKY19-like zinc finger domain-containing protein n=1 Tax=Phytophthora infestans TaxID=4787 RepID=A0A8S9U6P3_PHYIN|nr:hypothetical protein GN958_ATG19211 [Phytophthora infestans]KAF4134524.1 hypothetical protein GN958_ATG16275 [Phytophthora infestans]KAI9994303.1 hypothetical protein PInf_010906 [Phytophthora infestans]